jgi:hypothetical protein
LDSSGRLLFCERFHLRVKSGPVCLNLTCSSPRSTRGRALDSAGTASSLQLDMSCDHSKRADVLFGGATYKRRSSAPFPRVLHLIGACEGVSRPRVIG